MKKYSQEQLDIMSKVEFDENNCATNLEFRHKGECNWNKCESPFWSFEGWEYRIIKKQPKFKVGDVITDGRSDFLITTITANNYCYRRVDEDDNHGGYDSFENVESKFKKQPKFKLGDKVISKCTGKKYVIRRVFNYSYEYSDVDSPEERFVCDTFGKVEDIFVLYLEPKFKKGDRVIYNDNNLQGIIQDVTDRAEYFVNFGDGKLCAWVYEKHLKLVDTPTNEVTIKFVLDHWCDLIDEANNPTFVHKPFKTLSEWLPYQDRWVRSKGKDIKFKITAVISNDDKSGILVDIGNAKMLNFPAAFDQLEFINLKTNETEPFGVKTVE